MGEDDLPRLDAAQMGAVAHLYRGELYRSTVWRTRLDTTTNWAVVSTGIALSATFRDNLASPLPLVLVGLLVTVFLLFEARRYQDFDVWQMRARLLETQFYAPMLAGLPQEDGWRRLLATDLNHPRYHMSLVEAAGRRLRRNYGWILLIHAIAYYGKLAINPGPLTSLDELWARAAIGPLEGHVVILMGLLFHGSWVFLAVLSFYLQERRRDQVRHGLGHDRLKALLAGVEIDSILGDKRHDVE